MKKLNMCPPQPNANTTKVGLNIDMNSIGNITNKHLSLKKKKKDIYLFIQTEHVILILNNRFSKIVPNVILTVKSHGIKICHQILLFSLVIAANCLTC